MRQTRFLVAIASSVAFPAAAAAQDVPLSVSLTYEVANELDSCPPAAEFRRAIREQLRYDPFRDGAELRALAIIVSSELGLEGRILWTSAEGVAQGQRQLTSPERDCAELAKGMSFAVAVQIQLLNAARIEPEPEPPRARAAPTATPVASESTVSPPVATGSAARGSDLVVALGAGPTASFAIAPSLSAGGRVFGRVGQDPFSLELGIEAHLPVTRTTSDGAGFSVRSFEASLAPCARVGSFLLCALGTMGELRVEGFGVDERRQPRSTTASAGLRVGIEQALSRRLALLLHADGLALLTRRTVYLDATPVWTTPDLGLKLGFDVATYFR